MFAKSKTDQVNPTLRVMNQVGQGTTITGDVNTDGDVRIDGQVTGSVVSKSKVVVGATGVIDGNIICQNAHVDGRVQGNIEVAELLFLSKTASVTGDMKIRKLVVEDGAKFNGRCSMGMSVSRSETGDNSASRSKLGSAV